MLTNYLQHGSAKKLQYWWYNLPWRWRRRLAKMKMRSVLTLQRGLRCWLARVVLARLVAAREAAAALERARVGAAATRITALVRGYLGRLVAGEARRAHEVEAANADIQRRIGLLGGGGAGGGAGKKDGLTAGFKQKNAAIALQKTARGKAARDAVKRMRMRTYVRACRVIQRMLKRRRWRKKRMAGLLRIQMWFIMQRARFKRKCRAATRIVASYRRFVQSRRYSQWRAHATVVAGLLNPRASAYVARRWAEVAQAAAAVSAETALLGSKLFELSREDETKRQIFNVALSSNVDTVGETQELFKHYCAFGSRSASSRLGVNNFNRLFKDAPGLMDASLLASDCELIFMKSKRRQGDKVESHLHYSDFLVALQHVAEKRCPEVERWGRCVVWRSGACCCCCCCCCCARPPSYTTTTTTTTTAPLRSLTPPLLPGTTRARRGSCTSFRSSS